MGGGGGGNPKAADPVKRNVSGKTAQTESNSLIRRRGLASTKQSANSLGGGRNLGGR